jgi:hypothetical protein
MMGIKKSRAPEIRKKTPPAKNNQDNTRIVLELIALTFSPDQAPGTLAAEVGSV